MYHETAALNFKKKVDNQGNKLSRKKTQQSTL
jgi:hypothetical protein